MLKQKDRETSNTCNIGKLCWSSRSLKLDILINFLSKTMLSLKIMPSVPKSLDPVWLETQNQKA
jgi:hypothetical protein